MSEQDINLGLCKILNPELTKDLTDDEILILFRLGSLPYYTQDMNLLMPLCWEHGISAKQFKKGWDVTHKCGFWKFTKESPKTLIAECLLKVLQEKDGE